MKKHLPLLLFCCCPFLLCAQERPLTEPCGTIEHLEWLKQRDPQIEINMEKLEQEISEWMRLNPEAIQSVNNIFTIPVVVHVLWNASDSAGNISDEQIHSQLAILNADFRRQNADKSKTPAAFLPVAADCGIEFKLARQDPDSNPTSGILRKQTLVQHFGQKLNDIKISEQGGDDAWPKNKYLNIWVGTLRSHLLGYAQFPFGGPDSTDGIAITYSAFGTGGATKIPYHKGRVATHETGHWLNLKHIWGDDKGSCSGNDQIGDTPNQAAENYFCPGFPLKDICTVDSPGVMFMNYMDYTNDTCKNLFTVLQKNRMRPILKTGPRLPLLTSPGAVSAADSTPNIQWQQSLGGSSVEWSRSVEATTDGGFITAGYTWSGDGDVSGIHGSNDYWVVKLSANGNKQWQKCLGGFDNDVAFSVKQTYDGGFIVAGNTLSNSGDVTGHHGSYDCWIVKLSSTGNIEWQKCYGGTLQDYAQCIIQTADSGFAFAGYSNSNDFDVTGNHGAFDFWVVKLNATGDMQWQKSLGGSYHDYAYSLVQSTNGTFMVAGYTSSTDGQVTGYHGGASDIWVVKLSATGSVLWKKCYGGSLQDNANSISQTTTGDFIIAGNSNSINGDLTGTHGLQDFWVYKISSSGLLLWQLALGGSANDYAYDLIQAADGGYLVTGYTGSNNGDVTGNHGGMDYWVAKISSSGIFKWQKCFGGTGNDYGQSCCQAADGGYALAGYSPSADGDVTGNHGLEDFWIVKFSDCMATVKASPSQVFCPGTTPNITLTAYEEGTSYLWSTGATTKTILATAAGSYQLTITNGGCSASAKPVIIKQLDCNEVTDFYDTAITFSTIHLQWESASCGGLGFELRYSQSSSSAWLPTINIPYDPDGIYNYVLTGLWSSESYDIKVRSKCSTGVFSPWVEITRTTAFRNAAIPGSNTFQLYPDPASSVIHFQFHGEPGKATLSVYNLTGEKLKEVSISSKGNEFSGDLNIYSLAKGLYILQASSKEGLYNTRFVKQ